MLEGQTNLKSACDMPSWSLHSSGGDGQQQVKKYISIVVFIRKEMSRIIRMVLSGRYI